MNIFNKRYIVSPVSRPTAQNRHIQERYTKIGNSISQKTLLKKTKAVQPNGFSAVDALAFRRSTTNRNFIETGLSVMMPNPYYVGDEVSDNDILNIITKYGLNENSWRGVLKNILTSPQVSLQTIAEIRFGLDYDELTSRVPKDGQSTRISKTRVRLYDRANVFDTNNLNGFLAVCLLKTRTDLIHIPPASLNTSTHNWTMVEQSKQYENALEINAKQNKALARYVQLLDNYPNTMPYTNSPVFYLACLLRVPPANTPLIRSADINPATIDAKINDYLKLSDDTLEQRISNFNEVMDLFEKDKEQFMLKYLVRQAISKGVLVFKDGSLYWLSKRADPAWYQFTSESAFTSRLFTELTTGSEIFNDFIDELSAKHIPIPEDIIKIMKVIQDTKAKNANIEKVNTDKNESFKLDTPIEVSEFADELQIQQPKKKRGRPKKSTTK